MTTAARVPVQGIMLVIFALASVISYSKGKNISFEVLSILPASTDGTSVRLSGNTPLTVVFSVPVIRLGTKYNF